MVMPERLVPGMSANICATPIAPAAVRFMCSIRRTVMPTRSATKRSRPKPSVVQPINSMLRRATLPRIKVVTNTSDWILLVLLLIQIVLGIGISVFHGWGSSWFATNAAPWLWSLFTFSPESAYVSALPMLVKLHILNAWLIVGYFPFTRLIHVLVVPNQYLWRKTQVVMWHRDRKTVRIKD